MYRRISVREAARIQGFPDDWKICGSINEQYKQIGNAVPIKLGEAIARTIIADMQGKKLPQIPGYAYSRYKNTSDITWKAVMDTIIKKARAIQTTEKVEQLTLDH